MEEGTSKCDEVLVYLIIIAVLVLVCNVNQVKTQPEAAMHIQWAMGI